MGGSSQADRNELTGSDGLFPLTRRVVNGIEYEIFDRDPRTLRDAFLATAGFGSMDAVVYRDERWTFDRQWAEVVTLAHALGSELNVRQGDRVAIAMRNFPEWIFSFWATQLLGAVAVPLNAWLMPDELSGLLDQARPSVVIADAERIGALRRLDLRAMDVKHVVAVRSPEDEHTIAYTDLIGAGGPTTPPDAEIDPLDPATILFTSGTTGRPKAVVGTHLNHSASLLNKLIRAVRVSTDGSPPQMPKPGVKLVSFPFFHIAGVNTLYTSSYPGHRMVLLHKWDAEEAARLVEAEKVTELSGAPYMIQTFLDVAQSSGHDLSSLTSLGIGGASIPAHLIERIHRQFDGAVSPRTGYGLTESTSGVVAIGGQEWVEHSDSVGKALPTVGIAVIDRELEPVPVGTEGEIILRGPQVITSYLDDSSPDSFIDGWFRTGDLGRLDGDGFLHISGRLKDVVIRGGENINCAEVEGCLTGHPDVIEAAVFGTPHPTLGEELAAVIRLHPGAAAGPESLRGHVRERLASFKVPAHVVTTDQALPRTASGKIVKTDIVGRMGLTDEFAHATPS